MHPFPPTPSVDDAPADLFASGHLWLQEWLVGAPLRFRVDDAGTSFGDRERSFDQWDEPLGYRCAARHVRERFDADAVRAEVADPTDYVFYGVATRDEGIDYDWSRLPPFLGCAVYSAERGFLPPDAAERAFDRLGLEPVNAFEKEVPTRDFHPDRYETPSSAWYDGPAAGTLVRNKRGDRAVISSSTVAPAGEPSAPVDAETLVERYVTDERVDRTADALAAEGRPSVDAVLDRIVETIAREQYREFSAAGIDAEAFRAAAAERVARRIDD